MLLFLNGGHLASRSHAWVWIFVTVIVALHFCKIKATILKDNGQENSEYCPITRFVWEYSALTLGLKPSGVRHCISHMNLTSGLTVTY